MVYDAYNLSLINGTGLVPMMQTVNTELMFGFYGVVALITIGVMLFLSMIIFSQNMKKSMGFTTLFIAVLSILFRMISLVSDDIVIIAWILAAVSVMLSFFTPD